MTEIPRNMDDALAAFKKMVDEDPVIQSLKKWIADEEEKYLRRLMEEVVRLVTEEREK